MTIPHHRWQLAPDANGLDTLDYNNCLAEVTAMWAEIETRGALDTNSDVIRLLQDDQEKGIGWDDAQVALDRGRVEFGWPKLTLLHLNADWTRAMALLDEGRAMGLVIQSGLAPASCVPRSVVHAVLVLRREDAYTALVHDPYCRTGPTPWSLADLRRAAEAIVGAGKILSAVFTSPQEVPVIPATITDESPTLIDTPAKAQVFDLDGTTALTTLSTALTNRLSPYRVGGKRAIYVTTGGIRRVALVHPTATRPAPAADCAAAIFAATAPLIAKIQNAKTALG